MTVQAQLPLFSAAEPLFEWCLWDTAGLMSADKLKEYFFFD